MAKAPLFQARHYRFLAQVLHELNLNDGQNWHIVEKFRREGDAIFYDLTLEDPEVLVEPLVFPTRILRRSTGPNAGLIPERGHCETSFETEAAASQIRH